jgi:hypothetical protein
MTTPFGQILTTTEMNVAADGVTAEFVNSLNTNDNVQISRTFAGGGRGLFVDMGPGGQAVTGNGVEVSMGSASTGHALRAILVAGATGDGLHIEDAGSGPAIFAAKTGSLGSAIDISHTDADQSLYLLLGLNPAVPGRNAFFGTDASATATAAPIDIQSDALAAGATAGDISVASFSSGGGTGGGVVIQAGGAAVAGAVSDQVQVVAEAGVSLTTTQASAPVQIVATDTTSDIVFDARAMASPITLNEAGDLDLDGGFTATSIIGALNELFGGGGGGATLQTAYAAGNTIAVTTANGSVALSNAADTTDVLTIERTFVGSGDGIDINMAAGTTGRGLRVVVAGSGTGVLVTDGTSQTGISPGLIFQSSNTDLQLTMLSGGAGVAGDLIITVGTDTTAGGGGGDYSITAGVGTLNTGGIGGAGGIGTLLGGAGGAATGAGNDGGAGGALALTGGLGGDSAADTGGSGGAITLTGGAGGDGAIIDGGGGDVSIVGGATGSTSNASAGGNINIRGGALNSANGSGGDVFINPGADNQANGNEGDVFILNDDTLGVAANLNIGNDTNYPEVFIQGFVDVDFDRAGVEAFDIRAGATTTSDVLVVSSATGATGDYLIRGTQEGTSGSVAGQVVCALRQSSRVDTTARYGVIMELRTIDTGAETVNILVGNADPDGDVLGGDVGSLFLDGANGAAYIKTANPSTWAALSGGGGASTLDDVMTTGTPDNDVTLTTATGAMILRNTADSTDLIQLIRTNTGAGDAIEIQLSPGGEVQSSIGISMSLGTGHSSAGINVSSSATSNIAAVNAVQGGSTAGSAYRAFMTSGATGNAFLATDGTETLRLNLADMRASQAFTFVTDDNAGTGGVAGFAMSHSPGAGESNAAGAGGAGGAFNVTPGAGGDGSGANLGGAGGLIQLSAGSGGQSVTGQSGTGGVVTISGGPGGQLASGGTFGGFGGGVNILAGTGGAANTGAGTAGAGGLLNLSGGAGGAGTATGAAGAGGDIQVFANDAGADNGGGGATGGRVFIRGGAGSGGSADGSITIGDATTVSVNIASGANLGFFGATPVGQSSAYTPTNVTTDRAFDANSTTLDEIADVLGTLIADLQATGLLG